MGMKSKKVSLQVKVINEDEENDDAGMCIYGKYDKEEEDEDVEKVKIQELNTIIDDLNKQNTKLKEELDKYNSIFVPDMTTEQMKYKIKTLENTILTLESDLSTYKGEIEVYREYYDNRQKEVLKLQHNNIELTEIIAKNQIDLLKMKADLTTNSILRMNIETLHKQMRDLDKIRTEENLEFQQKIIELTEEKNKLELQNTTYNNRLEQIETLEMQLDKIKQKNISISDDNNTLNGIIAKIQSEKQTIVSKCILYNDRIVQLEKQYNDQREVEKNMKLKHDELNRRITLFENILNEKQNEISIMKDNKINSLEIVGNTGEYEGILYHQIKDIEKDNIKLKELVTEKDKQVNIANKRYEQLEDKIKSLLFEDKN